MMRSAAVYNRVRFVLSPNRYWDARLNRTLIIKALAPCFACFLFAQPVLAQQTKANQSDTYAKRYSAGRYSGNRRIASDEYRPEYDPGGDYRQPVSILSFDERFALVCTKMSGEVYRIDKGQHSVSVAVRQPGRQFGQIVSLGESRVAVTDGQNDEVMIYRRRGEGIRLSEVARVSVPGRPNGLVYDEEETTLWVSSVWGRRLHRFRHSIGDPITLRPVQTIDLPMCGGQVLCLPKQDLILVTDEFGCDFVMVDRQTGRIVNHDRLYGHNISQLVSIDDGAQVLFPHQLLSGLVSALQTDITWGNFLSNNLRWIRTDRLTTSSGRDIYRGSRSVPIGSVRNGSGDPTSIAIHGQQVAVTIGGTNQVALGSINGRSFDFVDVGFHPVDCEFSGDGSTLVVVNQFSDSVTFIDIARQETDHVSLGPIRPPTEIERGEQLFHDSTLSHDGWMSCQSCHSGGHTNGLLTDNFTDDTYRSPKRVLSLLGQAETAPYSWAGTMATLEDQIAFSIKSTMASDHPVRPRDVDRLAAYVRSLPPPPSVMESRSSIQDDPTAAKQVRRGKRVFRTAGCIDCHSGPYYTNEDTFDVGLRDERSMTEFNPPSLVAVSQRQNSLFHDGTAKSIRDVIFDANHQLPGDTTERQRRDLLRYLESL